MEHLVIIADSKAFVAGQVLNTRVRRETGLPLSTWGDLNQSHGFSISMKFNLSATWYTKTRNQLFFDYATR